MRQLLLNLIAPFRFISRYYARQALARMRARKALEDERAHQLALLQAFLTSLQTIQETSSKESTTNASALIEVAKAMTQQAQGFAEWMRLFQASAAPTTSVITEEDEWRMEQEKALASGIPPDIAGLDPEFQLAWVLKNDPSLVGNG